MSNRILATATALAIALAFGAGTAMSASVDAHGSCQDASGNGGGGSVGADSSGNVDGADAAEAQSILAGLQTFAEGTVADAPGQLGSDACHHPDDDDSDSDDGVDAEDGTHDTEDHISGEASAQGSSAGACYDNEGFHTSADCHGGSGGELPSPAVALP